MPDDLADQQGWALPDSGPSPAPVAPPGPAWVPPWPPPGPPPGRRPMPRWAKVVLGIAIAYYGFFAVLVIVGIIAYFAGR